MSMDLSRRMFLGLIGAAAPLPFIAPALAAGAAGDATPFGRAQAAFALDLIGKLSDGAKNATLSPSGIAAVMSVLDLGADKAMQAAIAATLRLSGRKGISEARKAIRELVALSGQPGSPIASADALFIAAGLGLKPGIEDKARAEGGAELKRVDFASPEAVETINAWAAEKTGGRILNLLSPGTQAELVAANAFAFKAAWLKPFAADATGKAPFTRADGSAGEAEMMYLAREFLRVSTKGPFMAVELGYTDRNFATVFVTTTDAPARPDAFAAAADLLAGKGLAAAEASVALPKLATAENLDLLEPLAALGLDKGLASAGQLSGFVDGLKLGAVKQKLILKVDEAGTEAAAATAALMARAVPGQQVLNLRFDKPFVHALRHVPTGAILMAGYVADPSAMKL